MSDGRPNRSAGWLALVAIFCVYAVSIYHPFVSWDDGIFILGNPVVTDPASASWGERLGTRNLGYPMPLPVWIHGWLWSLGGGSPLPFHALGVAIHLTNCGLLYGLLRRDISPGAAATAAAAFGLHPIVVEPVVWATALKDLLVGLGVLIAVRGLAAGVRGPIAGTLVALASKPSAVLLGPALWVHTRTSKATGRAHSLMGLGLSVAGLALLIYTVVQEPPELHTTAYVPFSVGRVLGALGLHVSHVLVPVGLAHSYPVEIVEPVHLLLGALATIGVLVLGIRAWRTRDPRTIWLAVGIAVYLPASNLRPLFRFTADSFFYVPWMATVAWVALGWQHRLAWARERLPKLAPAMGRAPLVLLPLWALLAFGQVRVWSSSVALWSHANAVFPGQPGLVFHLGQVLGGAGLHGEERALYMTNLEVLRTHDRVPGPLPLFFEREGQLDEADIWYGIAFDSDVPQPDLLYIHYADYADRHPERVRPEHATALRFARTVRARVRPQGSPPQVAGGGPGSE